MLTSDLTWSHLIGVTHGVTSYYMKLYSAMSTTSKSLPNSKWNLIDCGQNVFNFATFLCIRSGIRHHYLKWEAVSHWPTTRAPTIM